MHRHRLWIVAALLTAATLTSHLLAAPQREPLDPVTSIPRQLLENPPELLQPRHTASESEKDRMAAAALYATARLHEKNKRYQLALRNYQRAARYEDGDNSRILRRAVDVARYLDRHSETARLAVLLVQKDASDSLNLLRAFVYLSEMENAEQALKLYAAAVQRGEVNPREPAWIELHKLAGDTYFRQAKFRQAAEALALVEQAVQRPDDFGFDQDVLDLIQGDNASVLHLRIAEAYLEDGRIDAAKAAMQRAEALAGDRGLTLYNEARWHRAAGRPQESRAALQAYLDEHLASQGRAAYQLLADWFAKHQPAGDADRPSAELLEALEKAAADDPENIDLAYFLADQYVSDERYDDALGHYLRHLKNSPRGGVYRGLARIYLAGGKAEPLLDLSGELAGKIGSLDVLGKHLDALADDDRLVAAIVKAARRRQKKHEDQLTFGQRLAVGLIAAEAEKWDVADTFFAAAAVAAKPADRAGVYETWGLTHLTADRYRQAGDVFQAAIDEKVLADDNRVFHFYLAGALAMQDRFDDALEAAQIAAQAKPESAEFLGRVAWIQYRARRYDAAIDSYRRLIKRFDDQYDSSAVRDSVRDARLTLSHLQSLRDDLPQAVELIEQVLDEFPDDRGAANDLGYLWADAGLHLNRAHRMIQAACASDPDNMAYRDSLGWVLHRLGRHEEALKELQQAAAAEDPDGVILDHLGDVYQQLGRADDARQAWQRALESFELSEDEAMAGKVRKKLAGQ